MRVLIIGCGYVGLPLGAGLARAGHDVFGLRRTHDASGDLTSRGIRPVIVDITRREELESIPGPFDWIVNTVSSTKGGVEEYRAVYFEATKNLIELFSRRAFHKYVFTGSTSVYAQADGSTVTEESATEPASATSRVLVDTEQMLLKAAQTGDFPAVLLRVAGIYGPERGHLFQQFLRGDARMDGDGSRWINMVHRDDVVTAIAMALERGQPGQIYNVADDEPVRQREFYSWLSGPLARPMPPAGEGEVAARKRGVTDKRVSNRKLRLELGCELKYPTFRQGYSAEIARLQAAGQLPAKAGQ